jgi:hypothetical protein
VRRLPSEQSWIRCQAATFGAGYLDAIVPQEEAEAEAARNLDWDSDAQAMLDYIKANAPAKD